ncbi:hypothetical protein [Paenibacillus larvae]|uniref:hypothetical protein n=1 Tax=Paenibacillus larvae TaxID=1464 RepID=UPI001F1DEDFA|nr:hypothetical protein [Paenibacillus larvae]
MRRKVSLIVLSLLLLSFLALTGCSGSKEEKVTLNFWYGWTGPEADALEKLIKEFNDTHKEIQVKGLSQSDYQKQLTAITGGNPPDLASQFGQNVASWGVKGQCFRLMTISKRTMWI